MIKTAIRWTDFDYWAEKREHGQKQEIENVQHRILIALMHAPSLTFNQLWNRHENSNQFAYHLKTLVKQNLAEKTTKGYRLTREGKSYVSYLTRETGELWHFPIIAVITVIMDEKNNRVLLLERAQEPFLGHSGFHGGKLGATQYILECAQESIQKETGLSCALELKGLFSSKTFENKKLAYNHQLFIVKATKPTGKLTKKTEKGTNTWVTPAELKKRKILPNIPLLLKIAQGKRFRWIEADRVQHGAGKIRLTVRKDITL